MELKKNYVSEDVSLTNEFRAWLATQPAKDTYPYTDPCGCAFAQFLVATDRLDPLGGSPGQLGVGPWDWVDNNGVNHPLPENINKAVVKEPRTFGDALARLNELAT